MLCAFQCILIGQIGPSTANVQTENSQQLFDGLPWNLAQTFIAPRQSPSNFGDPYLFLYCYYEDGISGFGLSISAYSCHSQDELQSLKIYPILWVMTKKTAKVLTFSSSSPLL